MEEDLAPEQTTGMSKKGKTAIAVGAVAIVAAGSMLLSDRSQVRWSDEGNKAAAPQQVALVTKANAAEPAAAVADPASNIRGIVKPRHEATIASRITAKITAMPYREGQSFGKGALLVSFDCSTLRAQLNAANAATAAYAKTYQTNVELDAFEAVGRNDVAISKANQDKAQAEARAISAQLSDCAIHAPFAGIVVEQAGHAHEVAASGQPLMKIQNGNDLEVQLIVPSGWTTWLKPGVPFEFLIDETGQTLKGAVRSLGASVDPVSKTLRINGTIDKGEHRVLPGMSGSAKFDIPS